MKTYSVTYSTPTTYEAVIKAKNKKEAEKKVVEVIGQPIEIDSVYEVKSRA